MKKSIVLIPLPSLIKNLFVRSFVRGCGLRVCWGACVNVCVEVGRGKEVLKLDNWLSDFFKPH